jgi:hypothetical protein
MAVTLRSKDRMASVVLVAKWCVSRGEQVTIVVPSLADVDPLRAQFGNDELVRITFSMTGDATREPAVSSREP